MSNLKRVKAFAALFVTLIAFPIAAQAVTVLGTSVHVGALGSGYSIFGLQGIDPSTGGGSFAAYVNTDFEDPGWIGVSYGTDPKKLTDFGIGLYCDGCDKKGKGGTTYSTGLKIKFDALAYADSIKVSLADFDVKSTTDPFFFLSGKVEPVVALLDAGGAVIATATPTQIFSALTCTSGVCLGGSGVDAWSLSFASLTTALSLGNPTISGFVLYADSASAEKVPSDPYFFGTVTTALVIPEPESYAMLLAGLGLLGFVVRRRKQTLPIAARGTA